jgi:hypothetical protein
LFTPNVRGRAHLAIIKVFGHEPSLHLRLLNRAKASPQDEKAVEGCPVLFSVISPMPAVVANAPTSAIPTREPDFVFSIIAHEADAPADERPQPAQNQPRLWQDPGRLFTCAEKRNGIMSEERVDQERPCLHCMMVELIDDFFAEYPVPAGGSDKVDTTEADEVIGAIAKTVAELTSQQDGRMRQQLIEHLMREIMNYDAEFRSEEATGSSGSIARH